MTARRLAAASLFLSAITGCAGTTPGPSAAGVAPAAAPIAAPPPHVPAEVHFMSGMIHHHAQAVLMGGWAPSHGASRAIQALCERIVVGQQDEIAWMQLWLRDRNLPVPDSDPSHLMHGMDHGMLMPGMLDAGELAELDRARGAEFDRLFLQSMIRHHQGALTMIHELVNTPGAAREDNLFKLVSDMNADQTIEIERMTGMLAALPPAGQGP